MKISHVLASALIAFAPAAPAADDWLDRFGSMLTIGSRDGNVRAHLSGLLDLEGYRIEQPAPGLIFTERKTLVNPRLTLFLDSQAGRQIYAFAQARLDRGFDPGSRDAEVRLDEYAIRYTPWEDGRLSIQAGKFGSVVGNWVQRHSSWDSPFITAPVPYENLTGIWDGSAPGSVEVLRYWANIGPVPSAHEAYEDKHRRIPVIWGPAYTSGIMVSGQLGRLEYAAELKNASLSSRPENWDATRRGFSRPALSARLGYRPTTAWNVGFSASEGAYLLPEAEPSLPPGRDIGDYRQFVLGQDISFERHHLQVFAEFFESRFEVPVVGSADTFSYYLETKYKFTPQFFGALRWNQQLFASIPDGRGGRTEWGNDLYRIDTAIGYRFTPHTQLKLQYSLSREESISQDFAHTIAGQVTLKF
jgi:hypothetical protein